MRKGLLISGLAAVTIIAASLALTPASACHHRCCNATYGYYGDNYGYRHYAYRRYGWHTRRPLPCLGIKQFRK
jgi:hypothetical protein